MPTRSVNLPDVLAEVAAILGDPSAKFYLFGSRRQKTLSLRSDIDVLVSTSINIDSLKAQEIWHLEPYLDLFFIERGVARSVTNDSVIRSSEPDDGALLQMLDAVLVVSAGQAVRDADAHFEQRVLSARLPTATNANLYDLSDAVPRERADILVVTALTEEYKAVARAFGVDENLPAQVVEVTDDRDSPWRIALRNLNEMGSVGAAVSTQLEIIRQKPSHVVMLGICAGIPGRVKLNEVIVPSSVLFYESSKIDGRTERPNHRHAECDGAIVTKISTLVDDVFLQDCRPASAIAAGDRVMACGEKVVASRKFRRRIERRDRKIAGLDMESYGVARAASSMGVPVTIMKGVCDLADRRKNDDHHQQARDAAAATFRAAVRLGAFRPEP